MMLTKYAWYGSLFVIDVCLIPPPKGSRKSGLWQKTSEIVNALDPDPWTELHASPSIPAVLSLHLSRSFLPWKLWNEGNIIALMDGAIYDGGMEGKKNAWICGIIADLWGWCSYLGRERSCSCSTCQAYFGTAGRRTRRIPDNVLGIDLAMNSN